jgi:hypothetical protein
MRHMMNMRRVYADPLPVGANAHLSRQWQLCRDLSHLGAVGTRQRKHVIGGPVGWSLQFRRLGQFNIGANTLTCCRSRRAMQGCDTGEIGKFGTR